MKLMTERLTRLGLMGMICMHHSWTEDCVIRRGILLPAPGKKKHLTVATVDGLQRV